MTVQVPINVITTYIFPDKREGLRCDVKFQYYLDLSNTRYKF